MILRICPQNSSPFVTALRSGSLAWLTSALLRAVNLARTSTSPSNLDVWPNIKIPLYQKTTDDYSFDEEAARIDYKDLNWKKKQVWDSWRRLKLLGYQPRCSQIYKGQILIWLALQSTGFLYGDNGYLFSRSLKCFLNLILSVERLVTCLCWSWSPLRRGLQLQQRHFHVYCWPVYL